MIDLLDAVKSTIERYIVGRIACTQDPREGDTTIHLQTSRRLSVPEDVVVYSKPTSTEPAIAERRTIESVPDSTTIVIDQPLTQDYENAAIEKTVNGQFIDGVYLGDPPTLPSYPAITIEALDKDNEWSTLGRTAETHSLDVTVWASHTDYENQYRTMLHYSRLIENSLFRSLMPLVPPYLTQTLSEPITETDTLYRVTSDSPVAAGWAQIWFESADHLRMSRCRCYHGNGVYELAIAPGANFPAGSKVIIPQRYFYDAFPSGIQYGSGTDGDRQLKYARIFYSPKEECIRSPVIDPMSY